MLVVEDNVLNREVAHYVLAHAGAAVDFAPDGQAAVAMLAEDASRYDAVLMDLQMPVMDGYEATAAIRAMGLSALPVIAMTANAFEEDRRRALDAGMDDYIAKPVDLDELVATLERSGARARTAGTDGVTRPMESGQRMPARISGVDLDAALPRFGGNVAAFAALFGRFTQSQGGAADAIRASLAAGDRVGASHAAHRLRGVAANLGATEVARLALELEQALRGDAAAAPAPQRLLLELDRALHQVLDAARDLAPPDGPAPAPDPAPSPSPTGHAALRHALAHLLDLLHNNNMKAIAQFESMRPALARQVPAALPALADALAVLDFDGAARLVRGILDMEAKA
ncbi:response regulator [Massilia sp. TN1-12]|uniref:response regulator n=1 Tax=Massilia paldalensis TaxID=3377675 RepID=UPI00384AD112